MTRLSPARLVSPGLVLLAGLWLASAVQGQERIIELQVFCDGRAVVGTQQRWMEMLQGVGADRVVVKTGAVDAPNIEESKVASATMIYLSGSIENSQLHLPGGRFSINDKAGIRDLIQKLRDDGATVALAEKKAFGLTSAQLVELHGMLRKPLDFDTKGANAGEVIEKIAQLIEVRFHFDATAQTTLLANHTVTESLEGISAGTSLAVVLRPLGLVLQPQRLQGKPLELLIVDFQKSAENWPIGWPLEQSPVQAEPRLFEKLKLEIRGFPLSDALNAIEKRSGVPFFYDHNSFAREGVALSQNIVTVVQERASLMVAIGKLLRQCRPKLSDELRMDENGKPFLWITTQ
jgi:hypothetical protein